MLVITADESDSPAEDSSACCGEDVDPGPNLMLGRPGYLGTGRRADRGAGDLAVRRGRTRGARTPYNHYSLLASLEELYRLPKIGMAQLDGLPVFGLDVYNGRWQSG